MSFLRAALAVARKDLRVELRSLEVAIAMVFFAGLVLLLFAFAFVREGRAPPHAAAGILWIAVALAGTLGLGRAFDREREGDTFAALLAAPVERAAIYVGKVAGIVALLAVTEAAAVPATALLFEPRLVDGNVAPALALLLLLGSLGFAAVGTLFAATLVRNRARHVLLGILLYPIIVPVMIAGARGTQALLELPAPDFPSVWLWAKVLALFDAAFVVLALWVFEPLVAAD